MPVRASIPALRVVAELGSLAAWRHPSVPGSIVNVPEVEDDNSGVDSNMLRNNLLPSATFTVQEMPEPVMLSNSWTSELSWKRMWRSNGDWPPVQLSLVVSHCARSTGVFMLTWPDAERMP